MRKTTTGDPDIMTIEEVASYLRVSERTIYDWAKKAEIPCGKLGTTWRFKRSAIEEWVNRRLAGGAAMPSAPPIPGSGLGAALTADRVVLLDVDRKEEALVRLIDRLATVPGLGDRDMLTAEVFRREGLMSTAVGMALGVPHVRLPSLAETVMAVGVSARDIRDYVSLDGVPVRVICMIAAPEGQHAKYLGVLAAVIARLRDEQVRRRVLEATDGETVYSALTQG
jgi:nitrogen PTS system EIIA component